MTAACYGSYSDAALQQIETLVVKNGKPLADFPAPIAGPARVGRDGPNARNRCVYLFSAFCESSGDSTRLQNALAAGRLMRGLDDPAAAVLRLLVDVEAANPVRSVEAVDRDHVLADDILTLVLALLDLLEDGVADLADAR